MKKSRPAQLFFLAIAAVVLFRCEIADPKNFITADGAVKVQRLRITAANHELLWEIERVTPSRALAVLRYGEVPAGYRQNFPQRVRPRPLRPAENLALLRVSDTGIMCHAGVAIGADGFRGGYWSAMPFHHHKNPEADAEFARLMACSP